MHKTQINTNFSLKKSSNDDFFNYRELRWYLSDTFLIPFFKKTLFWVGNYMLFLCVIEGIFMYLFKINCPLYVFFFADLTLFKIGFFLYPFIQEIEHDFIAEM